MEFGIVGTSIWQQNMPLLERLSIDRDSKPVVLQELKTRLGVSELMVLSTCNRVEFLYVIDERKSPDGILHRLIDFFLCNEKDICFFPNDFFHYTGRDAITHLFRTASSLESLVVGETQITGQFKEAYAEANELGLTGAVLKSLSDEALQVARQVRRETSVGAGSVSMASLAATELQRALSTIERPVIALVGSGTMTLKLARHITKKMKGEIIFVNRTFEKAQKLALEFSSRAMSLDEFIATPPNVDGIVSATAAKQHLFDVAFVNRLPHGDHPIACIDLAIPRDFAADLDALERVNVRDIPFLKSRSQGNLRDKFVEASKANQIVRDAVRRFLSNRIEVSLKPIFHDSYRESVELAEQAFGDLFAKRLTSLDKEERQEVMRLVNKCIGHSSFQPVRTLSDHLVDMRSQLSLTDYRTAERKAG